jgi:hypothetical protein
MVRHGWRIRVHHRRAAFRFGPEHPGNEAICDLHLAPTNAQGLVEHRAQFHLLKPVEPEPHGRVLVDSINRGNMTAVAQFNSVARRTDAIPTSIPAMDSCSATATACSRSACSGIRRNRPSACGVVSGGARERAARARPELRAVVAQQAHAASAPFGRGHKPYPTAT